MLIGEYHHNLDEKGRIIIPSKFRVELGEEYVITKGLDKCLFVYTKNEWNKLVSSLETLKFTKKNVRAFERAFIGGASMDFFDKQGRINIPETLIKYANINKECVILGVNDRLEIWALEEFNMFMKENEDSLEEIAENLFTGENDET